MEFLFEIVLELFALLFSSVSVDGRKPLWQRITAALFIVIPALLLLFALGLLSSNLIYKGMYVEGFFMILIFAVILFVLIGFLRKFLKSFKDHVEV